MDALLLRRCIPFLFLWSSPVVFAAIGSQCQKNCSASDPLVRQDLAVPLGNSINIFHDYGFLSSTIHVAPIQNNFTEPHQLFRAHTQNVLDDNVYHLTIKRSSRMLTERQFELHLCDSVEELVSNYLHKFTVEGLHKPWKAFTASWRKSLLPRLFGIPAVYLTDEFRYVLVRIAKWSTVANMDGQTKLNADLEAAIAQLVDSRASIDFLLEHGTHLIQRYITGDAIYQVLVYEPAEYTQLRGRLVDFNIANATRANFIFLFPSLPTHVGKLQLASGNRTIVRWLESRMALSSLPKMLPSGIRLMAAPVLLTHIYRQLRERAVLGMNLMDISRAVEDPNRRTWLHETLNNLLRMWEYNM